MHGYDSSLGRFQILLTDNAEWFEFHGNVKEESPPDAPLPASKEVKINCCWDDADHAGDSLNCRSHTGILIFVNSAPITWYSKQQATIKSLPFGSEMVAF